MSEQRAAGELSEDEFVAAIEAAVEDGERNLCAGGVPPVEIAERVDRDVSTVRRHCNRLAAAGRLEAVEGVAPGSLQPRTGFLPAAGE